MIFCRFQYEGEISYGLVENHAVQAISPDPFDSFELEGDPHPFTEVKFLAPACPTKIVNVGLNYRQHVLEMKHDLPSEPVLFFKPPSSILSPGEEIVVPKMSERVDYEGELGVVIKKRAKDVNADQAPDFILGFTCVNDVTARDLQKKDGQWGRAKGFDTFTPVGPWIVTDLDPRSAHIETYLNGERKQSGDTSQMIFPVYELVSFISQVMTLEPGDIISTGTPPGIGPMQPGDLVDVSIQGIGFLRNSVRKA